MNNAVLIQHVYTGKQDDMRPMLELTRQRHADYCKKHDIDYLVVIGNMGQENIVGDWAKIELVNRMLIAGYKYVIWLDTDAVIVNNDVDLREACKGIGVTFDALNVINHYNVGVMYFENTDPVKDFVKKMLDAYPWKRLWHGQEWVEQAELNLLNEEYPGVVNKLENKWNAYAGCPCPDNETIVRAFHGMGDVQMRTWLMLGATR